MKGKRKILLMLLCGILCIGLMPLETFAADRTAVLTVDGVDALTTSSGEGWSYDNESNILTLNGYNGGSIIASYMDLNVVLAENSTNVISTSDEYGIAYYQDSFTSPYYKLYIEGAEGSTLDITARDHAVFSKGDLSIKNCNLTAKNTIINTALTGNFGCIFSEDDINIENSVITVETKDTAAIACHNYNTISGSTVKVTASMVGIHANNENLTISDSALDVTAGTGGLFSMFGTVHLRNCTGQVTADTAAIYAQNINADGDTELIDCKDLLLKGQYGIMTYSGLLAENGSLTFDNTVMGIFAYSASYEAVAQMRGNITVNCTESTPQLMRVDGSYTSDDSADVTGVILENTGDASTMRILLVGNLAISADTSYSRNILIPTGSEVTVAPEAAFDLSQAPSVAIEGTLTNKGTLTVNGADTANKGTLYNYGEIILADNKDIVNAGTIYSVCTSDFDITPYGENGIIFHENLIHNEEKPATHLEAGNIEYWYCSQCDKCFSDEQGTEEITGDIITPATPEHSADGTGWHSDKDNHWHVCECGETIDKAAHTYKWVTDKEATETEAGSRHEECTVCGYAKEAVKIPALGTSAEGSSSQAGSQTGSSAVPQTGDDSSVGLWLGLMLATGAALTGTMICSRRYVFKR